LEATPLRLRALRPALAVAAVAIVVAFVVATASAERTSPRNPATGATVTRLASLQSHRYAYWKVALGAFKDHPLAGLGSGGFEVRWLERRKIHESVADAHSLYVETAGELGLVGLVALAVFFAGVFVAARVCFASDPAQAAGPIAAFVVWAIHAGLDWLWEMPAVSLLALGLAATLVARAEAGPRAQEA
jgi:O-antigen ligase